MECSNLILCRFDVSEGADENRGNDYYSSLVKPFHVSSGGGAVLSPPMCPFDPTA